ncbi:MAG: O-antigen translocase, partial [Maribacter sp.]
MIEHIHNKEDAQEETFLKEDNTKQDQLEFNANLNKSSYRQIFKATSLFGGVQFIQILIGIVKTKFVAILLGAGGVGLIGLFNAPLNLIISIAGLGLSFSAVREISEAHGKGNQNKLSEVITTLSRWAWVAGACGLIITIVLSPTLSQLTFGNKDYTWSFVWLSLTLLIDIVSKAQVTVLQGVRRLQDLAKASVYGSFAGLLTAIPLFYFFGSKGIVPSFIITSITALLLSLNYSRKVKVEPVEMSFKKTFHNGKAMVKLGLVITFTGVIGFFAAYILSAFIGRFGGTEQVGLYNAGWSIIGQSTGLVFAAMSTDFFPRLSSVNQDNSKVTSMVNQQAEMVVLILAPILVLLIAFMPIVVRVLYTSDFFGVIAFASWMVISVLFKGMVWPVGFIFPAKGDVKTFGFIEITAMLFNISTNILGYYFFGLEGLGGSIVVNYIFGMLLTFLFAYKKYKFRYEITALKQFFISLICVVTIFIIARTVEGLWSYFYMA